MALFAAASELDLESHFVSKQGLLVFVRPRGDGTDADCQVAGDSRISPVEGDGGPSAEACQPRERDETPLVGMTDVYSSSARSWMSSNHSVSLEGFRLSL